MWKVRSHPMKIRPSLRGDSSEMCRVYWSRKHFYCEKQQPPFRYYTRGRAGDASGVAWSSRNAQPRASYLNLCPIDGCGQLARAAGDRRSDRHNRSLQPLRKASSSSDYVPYLTTKNFQIKNQWPPAFRDLEPKWLRN